MELNELYDYIKVQLNCAIGAYQSYQAGKITRDEFDHDLGLIADSATQEIALSFDDDTAQ